MKKAATRILAALGLLVVTVTVLPIDDWWIRVLVGPWNDPKGDVLIVLGADSLEDMIGAGSYLRSLYAIRVWRAGGFQRIVISGGTSNGGPRPVAIQMRDFLVCQGVPAEAITVETGSRDTHENALFTARLLAGDAGKRVLLTSDYHMFRAYRAFLKAGMHVEPRPFPDGFKRTSHWEQRWPIFVDLCQEGLKTAYYWARGWI